LKKRLKGCVVLDKIYDLSAFDKPEWLSFVGRTYFGKADKEVEKVGAGHEVLAVSVSSSVPSIPLQNSFNCSNASITLLVELFPLPPLHHPLTTYATHH